MIYSIEATALFYFDVEASNEEQARAIARTFVECAMQAPPEAVEGYNQGSTGRVVPAHIEPAIEGTIEILQVSEGGQV